MSYFLLVLLLLGVSSLAGKRIPLLARFQIPPSLTLGVVVLLTLVMTVIALLVMGRPSTATRGSQLVVPLLWGLAGSLVLIALIDAGRSALTAALGLPF